VKGAWFVGPLDDCSPGRSRTEAIDGRPVHRGPDRPSFGLLGDEPAQISENEPAGLADLVLGEASPGRGRKVFGDDLPAHFGVRLSRRPFDVVCWTQGFAPVDLAVEPEMEPPWTFRPSSGRSPSAWCTGRCRSRDVHFGP